MNAFRPRSGVWGQAGSGKPSTSLSRTTAKHLGNYISGNENNGREIIVNTWWSYKFSECTTYSLFRKALYLAHLIYTTSSARYRQVRGATPMAINCLLNPRLLCWNNSCIALSFSSLWHDVSKGSLGNVFRLNTIITILILLQQKLYRACCCAPKTRLLHIERRRNRL